MIGFHDVPQDERDAVMLVSTLVRAALKWDADPRIKKRATRAAEWLTRYDAKHPHRMLRDGAVLSTDSSTEQG